jgi:N-acetylglutamate synthase-like GNAT family acetyltransferase
MSDVQGKLLPHLNAFQIAATELTELASPLALADLPADDIAEPGRIFIRFREAEGGTVGFGGLEIHGRNALLRSITVMAGHRGGGRGRAIVSHLLWHAREAGAADAYLLTTTAQRFFEAQGFAVVARDKVPAAILATRQARGLCPATATVLTKTLSR